MSTNPHRIATALLLIAASAAAGALGSTHAGAAEATVGLGRAADYAVLAATTVTNTGPSTITGDLGVSPQTAVTGFPPGIVQDGSIHSADAHAGGAQADLGTAYVSAAGRSTTETVSADLAGRTLVGGVYSGATLALNGTLTLDAEAVPDTVWIFQAGSTLITGSNSSVSLVNGANPCNVFWQVGSSATLGTGTSFVGTVMALTSVTANTDATVQGRLLARNGAVTLDSNVITRPGCAAAPTTTVPATTSTTTDAGATTTVPVATTVPITTTTAGSGATTTLPVATTLPVTTTLPVATTLPVTTTVPGATTIPPVTVVPVPTTAIVTATTVASSATTVVAVPSTIGTAAATSTTAATSTPSAEATTTTPVGAPTTLVPQRLRSTPTTDAATTALPQLPLTGARANLTAGAAAIAVLLGATLLRSAGRIRRALDA